MRIILPLALAPVTHCDPGTAYDLVTSTSFGSPEITSEAIPRDEWEANK